MRNPVIDHDFTVSAVGRDSLELGTLRLPDKRRIKFSEEEDKEVIVNKAAEKEEAEEDGRSYVSDAFLFEEPTLSVEIARTLSLSPPKPPKPVRQRIQESFASVDKAQFEKKQENSVKSYEEDEDVREGDEWRKFSDSASTQDKDIVDEEMYSLPPDQLAGRPWYMGPGPGASDAGSGISLEVDLTTDDQSDFSKPHPEHHYANIIPKRLVSDIPQPLHNNNRDVSQSMQHLSSKSLQRTLQKNVSMRTSLQQNLSLRTTLSRSDYRTMNQFSDTMERLKKLMSEEDVRRIEISMASIEQIIDPRETSSSDETDDATTGHDVSSRELSEEDEVVPARTTRLNPFATAASMDNIISNLDNMIGDMDNWADDETDVVKLEITSM